MHVMMVVNDTTFAYNLRREIISQLIQEGHKVTLMCQVLSFVTELEDLGAEIIDVKNNRRGTNPFADLKLFITYFTHLRREKPDIILGNNIKPNVYAGIACRLLKIRRICNVTGLGTALEQPGLLQKLTAVLYKAGTWNAECILFQNSENLAFFETRAMISSKTRVVLLPGSGVNLDAHPVYEYPRDDTIRFLFVARILKEKGVDYFLAAAREIRKHYPQAQFHICGKCDDDTYIDVLEKASAAGDVIYHGEQQHMGTFFKMTHCVVHPSYYPEGMSNVLLEAAASARPVITTDRCGCRETVNNGVSGFVVPIKDVNALIRAIEQFIRMPWEERRNMGLAGRRKMEKEFDRSIVVHLVIDEIRKSYSK